MAVQAVALFGAILATIALAINDRRSRAAEKRAVSGFFAAGLLTPLGVLRADVTRSKRAMAAITQPQQFTETALQTLEDAKLRIPSELDVAMTKIHLMDPAVVSPLQTCVTRAKAINALVDGLKEMAAKDVNRFEREKGARLDLLNKNRTFLSESIVKIVGDPYR